MASYPSNFKVQTKKGPLSIKRVFLLISNLTQVVNK
jgi:hypothetical protein